MTVTGSWWEDQNKNIFKYCAAGSRLLSSDDAEMGLFFVKVTTLGKYYEVQASQWACVAKQPIIIDAALLQMKSSEEYHVNLLRITSHGYVNKSPSLNSLSTFSVIVPIASSVRSDENCGFSQLALCLRSLHINMYQASPKMTKNTMNLPSET